MTQNDVTSLEHSSALNELATALAKAQAKVRPAVKDATNPHFRSSYADLASVWDACREPLTENGLSIAQFVGYEDGPTALCTLTTLLLHSSGQWIRSVAKAPVQKPDAQGVGSVVTYLRRYALAAVAGVAPEDDDGNAARRPVRDTPGYGETVDNAAPPIRPSTGGGPVMPFGKDKGTPLADLPSDKLVSTRQWCEKTDPAKFAKLMGQLDDVLAQRADPGPLVQGDEEDEIVFP